MQFTDIESGPGGTKTIFSSSLMVQKTVMYHN